MGLRPLAASGIPEPQSCGLTEVASGIDALYMSGRGEVAPALLADLAAAKGRAEESDEAVPFDLGGCVAMVEPRSFGKYRFRLATDNGLIGVSPSSALPPLRIQPRSEHLHGVGASAAVEWFRDLAATFTRDLRLTASRLDVFSDWQGLEISVADRSHFVGRAKRLDTHEDGGQLTGFEFGRRKTNTIAGRIYDKTVDIHRTGKLWWLDRWGSAYDPSRAVLRVEFEFGRQGLTEYGVDTASDALARAADLYLTAATEWLSQRVPTSDLTRSRWPVSPVWQVVQRPSFAECAIGLPRIRERGTAATIRRILPPLVGYLATLAALSGTDDVEGLQAVLTRVIRDDEIARRVSFPERVRQRRLKLMLT